MWKAKKVEREYDEMKKIKTKPNKHEARETSGNTAMAADSPLQQTAESFQLHPGEAPAEGKLFYGTDDSSDCESEAP